MSESHLQDELRRSDSKRNAALLPEKRSRHLLEGFVDGDDGGGGS